MEQELFLRDDIIDLSSQLDSKCFNIKAYRKRNSINSSRNSKKPIQSTQYNASEDHDLTKAEYSADKFCLSTNILSSKRLSMTAACRKRSHVSDSFNNNPTKTAMSKHNSQIDENDQLPVQRQPTVIKNKIKRQSLVEKSSSKVIQDKEVIKKQNNFSHQQKEISKKGSLKDKYLQNWLNQILIEYCSEQKFDLTIENCALKKFGIDKNALLSRGIKPESLQRIFKSLFVYSMGFNTLLKDLCEKNMSIRKTIWKVYAILLEYCSNGHFQTMIGEIQRDKVIKLDSLKEEIQKRQRIIENNDQINQEKNAKIFKELKSLREENTNLQNDKIVLMEDFKEAEQAFNEEVSLRLRFQNKINQIHGVHRELGIKHARLYEDLKNKVSELAITNQKYHKLNEKYLIIKNDYDFFLKDYESLKKEHKFNTELLEELKISLQNYQLMEIQEKNKKLDANSIAKENQRKIQQIKIEKKNMELVLTLKEESQKDLQKEYEKSLEANRKLNTTIQQQIVQLNELFLQKRGFNEQHISFFATIEMLKQKVEAKDADILKRKNDMRDLNDKLNENTDYIEQIEGKIKHMDNDMKDCIAKIDEMKRVKNLIEEDLNQQLRKQHKYTMLFKERDQIIANSTLKIQELEKSIAEQNIHRKSLESKIQLFTHKLSAEEETSKKKIQKLKEENSTLAKQNQFYKSQYDEKSGELERYTNMYEQTYTKLRDQLFQRGDLELRYKQSLTVVQSETQHIKKLNIKISEVSERLEEQTRKIRSLEYMMEGKEKLYLSEISILKTTLEKIRLEYRTIKNYIHPMKYQDALWLTKREYQNRISSEKQYEIKLKEITKQLNIASKKVELLEKQQQINKEIYQENMKKKLLEIQYEKQKEKYSLKKIEELELRIEGYKQGDQRTGLGSNFKEKQKKYLDAIKERSAKIEELLKENQKIQDYNLTLLKRIEETQNLLKKKQEILIEVEKQVQNLNFQKRSIQIEKKMLSKEKETIEHKIQQYEQNNNDEKMKYSRNNKSPSRGSRDNPSSRDQKSNPKQTLEPKNQKGQNPPWRTDLKKKIKNAYQYYNK